MLKKYNLVKDADAIDYDALNKFADAWAQTNADFQPAMTKAKEQCIGKQLPGPPQICEANKIVFCISSILFKVSFILHNRPVTRPGFARLQY
jgi:hypothetical protein